jgi:membrane-bound ClpP family serine protease
MTQKNSKDLKQLNILSICHYLYGSMFMMVSLFVVFFSIKGIISILLNPQNSSPSSSNPILAVVVFAVGLGVLLTLSICLIASGYFLSQIRRYWFVKKMAQFELYFFPVGTILGLYTLYFLSKTSVKSLYGIDSNR